MQSIVRFVLESNLQKAKESNESLGCDGPPPCMTNPAATFCICMGGKYRINEIPSGQQGICIIEGVEYDEWEYFRQMNPEDNTYSSNN